MTLKQSQSTENRAIEMLRFGLCILSQHQHLMSESEILEIKGFKEQLEAFEKELNNDKTN